MKGRPYTDEEIRALYRQAKHKREQIEILADLNCCTADEIRKIIFQEGGVPVPSQKSEMDTVCVYIEAGHSVEDAAAKYDLSVASINRALGQRKRRAGQKKPPAGHDPAPAPPAPSPTNEYSRIEAILETAQPDDTDRVKNYSRYLVTALADQMANKVIPPGEKEE